MSDVIELVRGLDSMLDHMRADYAQWMDRGADPHGTRAKMTEEYCASLHYYMGKKYVKITDGSSVKAFVVACEDDKKFQYGDILNQLVGRLLQGTSVEGMFWIGLLIEFGGQELCKKRLDSSSLFDTIVTDD